MSRRFLIVIAVLIILAASSEGQDPLPLNLIEVGSYTTSPYSTVSKIQTRVVPTTKGSMVVCVGIQYQATKFDLLTGTFKLGLLSPLTVLGSISSNVQDFSLMDKGTPTCEHVVLTQSGGITSDFGTSTNLIPAISPKKVALSMQNYADASSARMYFFTNGTGFTAYNALTGPEWSYTNGNDFNSISVANYGVNMFAALIGSEAGLGPAVSGIKVTGSPYSTDGVTTNGARAPYYTATTDGTRIYCYDNGASLPAASAIFCGTSTSAEVSVVGGSPLNSVQVSPVQSTVVAMTAAEISTTPRFKLFTLSTSDLSTIDSWNGYNIFAPFLVSSHSSSNLIGVAYTETTGAITFRLFQYTYSPTVPNGVAPIPLVPIASPFATPITPPIQSPVASPFGAPITTPFTSPVASPFTTPIAGPVNEPVNGPLSGPVNGPSTGGATPQNGVTPSTVGTPVASNDTNVIAGPPSLSPAEIGLIVGLIVGGAVLATGVFLLVFFLKKKQRKKKKNEAEPDEVPMTETGEPETYGNIPGVMPNNKYSAMAMTGGSGPSSDDVIVPANIQPSEIDKRLHIPHRSLVFVKEIGAGSYGKVYLGEWRGAKVAIKVNNTITDVDGFLAEAKLTLGIPPHPNLVQTFGVSLDGPNPCIVLEYCGGGSLDQLFKVENGLTNAKRIEYALKIAYGLAHLHSRSIVHRDLAARNILLTNDGQPKISDFGMSRIVQEEAAKGRTKTNVGPIRWMAPESLQDRSYSLKTDVWTYGIMLFEIVSGKEPHEEEDQFEIALKIRDKGFTPPIPDYCDPVLRECMEMCWKKAPADRPTMEEVCDFLRAKTE